MQLSNSLLSPKVGADFTFPRQQDQEQQDKNSPHLISCRMGFPGFVKFFV